MMLVLGVERAKKKPALWAGCPGFIGWGFSGPYHHRCRRAAAAGAMLHHQWPALRARAHASKFAGQALGFAKDVRFVIP
jgi:hypothetical protein